MIKELIEKARYEAADCYSSEEVLDWIDWFEKELSLLETELKEILDYDEKNNCCMVLDDEKLSKFVRK